MVKLSAPSVAERGAGINQDIPEGSQYDRVTGEDYFWRGCILYRLPIWSGGLI